MDFSVFKPASQIKLRCELLFLASLPAGIHSEKRAKRTEGNHVCHKADCAHNIADDHRRYGWQHAEERQSDQDNPADNAESPVDTAYVTYEPHKAHLLTLLCPLPFIAY